MKKTVIYIFGLLLRTTQLLGQSNADDHAAIAKTLNYYLEGGTKNDFSILEKAFHPEATMRYMKDGVYTSVNAVEFFEKGMKPGPAQDRKTAIVSVDVVGNAAQARLLIEYETFYFHDYMQLLKTEEGWKITGKIFNKEDK